MAVYSLYILCLLYSFVLCTLHCNVNVNESKLNVFKTSTGKNWFKKATDVVIIFFYFNLNIVQKTKTYIK